MQVTKDKIIFIGIITVLVFSVIRNSNKGKTLNRNILKEVTLIEDGKLKSENECMLVLVTGKISFDAGIQFEELGKSVNSFKVVRSVKDLISYRNLFSREKTIKPKIGGFSLDAHGFSLVNADESFTEAEEMCGLKWNGMEYTDQSRDDEKKGRRCKHFLQLFQC